MRIKNVILLVLLLLGSAGAGFSQGVGVADPHYAGIFDWVGGGIAEICEADGYVHYVAYTVWGGKVSILGDTSLGARCKCPTGSSNSASPTAASRILDVRCILPNDYNGTAWLNLGGLTPIRKYDWTLTTGGSPPPLSGGVAVGAVEKAGASAASEQNARAATGSTAYVDALPYRNFGLPPLYSGSQPTRLPFRCNSQLSPTGFGLNVDQAVVYRYDLCSGALIADIPVPPESLQIAVTPDGKMAIVTGFDGAISFIDADTNKLLKTIKTPVLTSASGIAIAPDASYSLVTNIGTGPAIWIVDLAAQAMVGSIPLDRSFPQSVFLNPDATLAWVTFPFDNVVEVIDVLSGIVSRAIPVPAPTSVAFNPTGTTAFVASGSADGGVLAIDAKTYAIVKKIPTGAGANDLQLSTDGVVLTVNNYYANSMSIIDTATLASETIPLTATATGVVNVPVQ